MKSIFDKKFDIIIVGGGHSGIEASFICNKLKKKVLLITHKLNKIGEISCNPSIGGVGKSHLVKEIDSLGGLMGLLADSACIQSVTLNSSKGYAVRSTRFQIDRKIYKKNVLKILFSLKYLTIFEDEVIDLLIDNNIILGIKTKKYTFYSKSVILTTGTFLNGRIFIGDFITNGGRLLDCASNKLANSLIKLPLNFGYFKTGTPPRIDIHSINFKVLNQQKNEKHRKYFSFFRSFFKKNKLPKINCFITFTNNLTHQIIKKNLNKSPLYNGLITGLGPRYCPSIENKVVNFLNKDHHIIFLERESLCSKYIYPNGLSTSLPVYLQQKIVNSIKGMENAKIVKPGYAVEYLYFDPKNLNKTLECKFIKNLYFAGQINGTTGYEEAAAQGIIAGINASLKTNSCKLINNFILSRSSSYIGVLIDDLCNKGVNEPYRIFTSRSEHRLFLREDNADYRLTPLAYDLGLINKYRWFFFRKKMKCIKKNLNFIRNTSFTFDKVSLSSFNVLLKFKKKKIKIKDLFLNSKIKDKYIISLIKERKNNFFLKYFKETKIIIKYENYINKQEIEVLKNKMFHNIKIPSYINYNSISGLSKEVIEILNREKPTYLSELNNFSGITPCSIIRLLIYLKNKF